MEEDKRYCEPRPIGEILEDILRELRFANEKGHELESRIATLEERDQVLTPAEAARFVGRTTHTLKSWAARGKITFVEQGGIRGYRLSDLKRIKTVTP